MLQETLWVWLAESLNKGSRKGKLIVDSFPSIEEIYAADKNRYAEVRGITKNDIEKLSDKSLEASEKIVAGCFKKGIRIITPHNAEYPKRLWQIDAPPVVLYARGKKLDVDDSPTVAMVGTRNASKNGEKAAERIAYDLAERGVTIVSGMAKGIDGIASYAALRAKGSTVAVFGCGADVIYPREHKALAEQILREGTVVSEFPPGSRPEPRFFPMRNRIISGLSVGTIIVEAPEKSGALITARYALEQNRDLFAVPAEIFNKSAEGTNNLLKVGAIPVTSAGDVLAEYIYLFGDKIKLKKQEQSEENNTVKKTSLTEDVLSLFKGEERAIIAAMVKGADTVDELVQICGISASQVLSNLTLLEIRGHIKRLPGNRFYIKD